MRDFGNGWQGLKDYAASVGVVAADDNDDVAAAKIKAVLQGTAPEEDVVAPEEEVV